MADTEEEEVGAALAYNSRARPVNAGLCVCILIRSFAASRRFSSALDCLRLTRQNRFGILLPADQGRREIDGEGGTEQGNLDTLS